MAVLPAPVYHVQFHLVCPIGVFCVLILQNQARPMRAVAV